MSICLIGSAQADDKTLCTAVICIAPVMVLALRAKERREGM